MIAALEEHANEDPNKSAIAKETARYLQACHLMFEKGILSHVFARSTESAVFKNMQEGWRYFVEWAEEHNNTGTYMPQGFFILIKLQQNYFNRYFFQVASQNDLFMLNDPYVQIDAFSHI